MMNDYRQLVSATRTALYRAILVVGLLLCAHEARAQELLHNGGFEAVADSWAGCGGVEIVDAQDGVTTAAMVRTGRYAGRVGGITNGSCGYFPASQFD